MTPKRIVFVVPYFHKFSYILKAVAQKFEVNVFKTDFRYGSLTTFTFEREQDCVKKHRDPPIDQSH